LRANGVERCGRATERYVLLIFMHIPKTAGTSLRQQLTAWHRPGQVVTSYGNELCAANPNWHFIEAVKHLGTDVKVVMGHFGWGAHELLGRPGAPYATILREPLARAGSYYAHVARDPRSRHCRAIQNGMTLKQMVLSHRAPELNNHYVRSLLGSDRWQLTLWPPDNTDDPEPIAQLFDPQLLEEAWNRLTTHFCHVGRTECYANTLAALAQKLEITPTGSPAAEIHLNARPTTMPPVEMDAETAAVVRHYNALDIELYQRVKQRWG